jgi:hypothetical protein
MIQRNQKMFTWLNTEKQKDNSELEREKQQFIKNIQNIKREEIFENKRVKLTIWQKLKKVLMGI